MSDITKGIRTYLLTVNGVQSLTSTRIYPDLLPQNASMPAVVLQVVAGDSAHHLGGGEGNTDERVQCDCYATTRTGANALGEAVRVALHGYVGAAGTETVQSCLMESKLDAIDQPDDGDSYSVRYRKILDFAVVHTEAATTS